MVHLAVRLRPADEGGQLRAADVAQDVHREQPVLRAHVAGAEHRAVARGAVDARDAEPLVAQDRDVVARAVALLDVALAHTEARILEVRAQVAGLHGRAGEHEVLVGLELIVGVRRAPLGDAEGGEVRRARVAVLARREDVAKAPGVVGLVGLGLRRGPRAGRVQRGDDDRRRGNPRRPAPSSRSSLRAPHRPLHDPGGARRYQLYGANTTVTSCARGVLMVPRPR